MYDITKRVILSDDYELESMSYRLKSMWARGDITEEQMDELLTLARKHADPKRTADFDKRLTAVEARLDKLEQSGTVPGPAEDWPEYQAGRNYQTGDKITFEGARYICKRPEGATACVWSPAVMPDYWVKQL